MKTNNLRRSVLRDDPRKKPPIDRQALRQRCLCTEVRQSRKGAFPDIVIPSVVALSSFYSQPRVCLNGTVVRSSSPFDIRFSGDDPDKSKGRAGEQSTSGVGAERRPLSACGSTRSSTSCIVGVPRGSFPLVKEEPDPQQVAEAQAIEAVTHQQSQKYRPLSPVLERADIRRNLRPEPLLSRSIAGYSKLLPTSSNLSGSSSRTNSRPQSSLAIRRGLPGSSPTPQQHPPRAHSAMSMTATEGAEFAPDWEEDREVVVFDKYGEAIRRGKNLEPAFNTNPFFYFKGDYEEGKKNGLGTLTLADGTSLHGTFVNSELEGAGVKYYPDGSSYHGVFVRGEPHGHGEYVGATNGEHYVGGFVCGLRSGNGTFKRYSDYCYEGGFDNHKFNGTGTLTTSTFKYAGEFVDGKMHGRGSIEYESGDEYTGEFRDSLPNGDGALYTVLDDVTYVGPMGDGSRMLIPSTLALSDVRATSGASSATLRDMLASQCVSEKERHLFVQSAEHFIHVAFGAGLELQLVPAIQDEIHAPQNGNGNGNGNKAGAKSGNIRDLRQPPPPPGSTTTRQRRAQLGPGKSPQAETVAKRAIATPCDANRRIRIKVLRLANVVGSIGISQSSSREQLQRESTVLLSPSSPPIKDQQQGLERAPSVVSPAVLAATSPQLLTPEQLEASLVQPEELLLCNNGKASEFFAAYASLMQAGSPHSSAASSKRASAVVSPVHDPSPLSKNLQMRVDDALSESFEDEIILDSGGKHKRGGNQQQQQQQHAAGDSMVTGSSSRMRAVVIDPNEDSNANTPTITPDEGTPGGGRAPHSSTPTQGLTRRGSSGSLTKPHQHQQQSKQTQIVRALVHSEMPEHMSRVLKVTTDKQTKSCRVVVRLSPKSPPGDYAMIATLEPKVVLRPGGDRVPIEDSAKFVLLFRVVALK